MAVAAAQAEIAAEVAGGPGPGAVVSRRSIRLTAVVLILALLHGCEAALAGEPGTTAEQVSAGAWSVERESRPLGSPGPRVGANRRDSGAESAVESERSFIDHPLVRTGGALAIVLGLIYGLARAAERLNARGSSLATAFGAGPSPSGVLEVLGRFPLGRGQSLVLLKVDNRVLLLAQSTPGLRIRGGGGAPSVTTLCEITTPEEVASLLMKVQDAEQASTAARFGDLLGRFDARHEEAGGGVVDLGAGGGGLMGRLRAMRAGPGGGGR